MMSLFCYSCTIRVLTSGPNIVGPNIIAALENVRWFLIEHSCVSNSSQKRLQTIQYVWMIGDIVVL